MYLLHQYVTKAELEYIVRDLAREINSLKHDITELKKSLAENSTEALTATHRKSLTEE